MVPDSKTIYTFAHNIIMENLPVFISVIFILTTALTVWFFYKASQRSKYALAIILLWLILQGILSLSGFYLNTSALPPRIIFILPPTLLLMLILFLNVKGRIFLDNFDIKTLTLLHIVRIPVEVVLYLLFVHQTVPQLMTFEGRNFDILSGITAPFIYYFGFIKQTIGKKTILAWNFICLALLVNIVVNAILSAPLAFQQFAFDQPNIAILYFPFIWLPCIVVPIVLFSHLVTFRQLITEK